MPDVIPETKRGKASAYLTFFATLGSAVGPLVTGLLVRYDLPLEHNIVQLSVNTRGSFLNTNPLFIFYVISIILLMISNFVTYRGVKEQVLSRYRLKQLMPKEFFKSAGSRSRDFFVFILYKLPVMISITAMNVFLLYFIRDCLE